MIAAGDLASMSFADIDDGTISEYTAASRTRRAISWAYWAPKSTTRTGWASRSLLGWVTGTAFQVGPESAHGWRWRVQTGPSLGFCPGGESAQTCSGQKCGARTSLWTTRAAP